MYSLNTLHTFGLSAQAQNLVVIEDINQIQNLPSPFWILGEGSNCLFVDDFQGTIIRIALKGITVDETDKAFHLAVGAGENWHQLVKFCLQKNMNGLENLALIPGTVGAAPIQNIGAYGVEVNRFINKIEYVDLDTYQLTEIDGQNCQFGYRDSVFKHSLFGKALITKVHFTLPKLWQGVSHYGELSQLSSPTAADLFDAVVAIRRKKLPDPAKIGNAGSFFKNPLVTKKHLAALHCQWPELPFYNVDQNSVKIPAAWLIDRLGFKGTRCGGIQCHPDQPLVLTNDGTGTAEQLLSLARSIQSSVKAEFSIQLENEVRLVGKKGIVVL